MIGNAIEQCQLLKGIHLKIKEMFLVFTLKNFINSLRHEMTIIELSSSNGQAKC